MSPWPGLIVAGGIGIWAVVALWVIGLGCQEMDLSRFRVRAGVTNPATAFENEHTRTEG